MKREIVLNGKKLSYELTRKQVKNINLRVRYDAGVYVSAPPHVTVASIEHFMQDNAHRILDAVEKANRREDLRQKNERFEDGGSVFYLGEPYRLRVLEGLRNEVRIGDGEMLLTVKDPTDPALRRKTLDGWLAARCREQVTALCQQIYPYFEARGVKMPTLRFRFMKTRWGSCNAAKGILTFNNHLAKKPVACIEYVVAHEFTHFLHADHSKRFYGELEKIMPDWRARKQKLNQ